MFLVVFYSPITIPNVISTIEKAIDIGKERGPADLSLADGVAALGPDVLDSIRASSPEELKPRSNEERRHTFVVEWSTG